MRQSPQSRFLAQIINKFRISAIAASTALLFACSSQEIAPLPLGVSLVETVTAQQDILNIPFKKYKLANGLTVILHQDNSDPLVHVDVT
ncbi:MAG: zinc protease, partial [Flavobacteriales bacterium]